ncbi:uncharacterized protein MONOS_5015 [Monocercomonoides exilis]|uniref:uncharacterized protein n=1 Tax=Monocercomonoides exilis TaxID=2049356 RepID=UPI00355AAA0A|nr:hypothetical protein MONOS_5015 [Monocercomonoides exilis]|eukprot:MONOS_5015.1-p1 / transcript=MONOS_5015.1 / gene=MONOS_5015 / organism=Monocercomonoides_exilis_PA203 / gene_product=unspecified product / transcript_product=unspecified product / location=Mono_scaffold00141:58220-59313(+) / protein_length=294 / sequence_SO=supercontig / SO=protein_coding / is_pseudo=false
MFGATNPFASPSTTTNPFATTNTSTNPFATAASTNPFATPSTSTNPFLSTTTNPFASNSTTNPFAPQKSQTQLPSIPLGMFKVQDLQDKKLILDTHAKLKQQLQLSIEIDEMLRQERKIADEVDELMGPIATKSATMKTDAKGEKQKIRQLERLIHVENKNVDGILRILERMKQPNFHDEIVRNGTSQAVQFFVELTKIFEKKMKTFQSDLQGLEQQITDAEDGDFQHSGDDLSHLVEKTTMKLVNVASSVATLHESVSVEKERLIVMLRKHWKGTSVQLVKMLEELTDDDSI